MENWNNELDSLFAEYKSALPDFEPSADFTPKLWRRIEARRGFAFRVRKLTQVFVAAAAAICLALTITGVLVAPGSHRQELRGTYIDALAEAHPAESLAALGIVHADNGEANTK